MIFTEADIVARYDVTGADATVEIPAAQNSLRLPLMSLCFLTWKDGQVTVGVSQPRTTEDFNDERGRQFAYEEACRIRKWPHLGRTYGA